MNFPEKFWKTIMILAGFLTLLVIIISIKEIKAIAYVGVNPVTVNSITVNGTGDAVAIPDVATFSFTVTETGATVAAAQSKSTDKINSSLKAVKDAGVDDKDIQTTSYSINPHYDNQNSICSVNYCPPGRSVQNGYDVSESIQVKVRDLTKAGAIFTSMGTLGVQNLQGINFAVDKPDAVQGQARAKAIIDAESKAKELASQLGVSLVRIISFDESGQPGPIMYAMGAKAAAMDSTAPAAPQIAPGESKVTDNVTITYEVK